MKDRWCCIVVAFISFSVMAQTVKWNGGSGLYTDATKWDSGSIPSASATAWVGKESEVVLETDGTNKLSSFYLGYGAEAGEPAKLSIISGSLMPSFFFAGSLDGKVGGEITQTGGSLITTSEFRDPAFSLGGTDVAWSIYRIQGGLLKIDNSSNARIGDKGYGRLEQTGGTVQCDYGYFVLGRLDGSAGEYDLSGGMFKQSGLDRAMVVGEVGKGKLTVRENGVIQTASPIMLGGGDLILQTGGVIRAAYFGRHPAGAGNHASVLLDGGTIAPYGPTLIQNSFLKGMNETSIGNGGVSFSVDEGRQITIEQSITAAMNATTGGVTKTGKGVLSLVGANSYSGMTHIAEGTLVMGSERAVPGWNEGRLTAAEGTTICVELGNGGWSETGLAEFLRQPFFGENIGGGVSTRRGSTTISAPYVTGNTSFSKLGRNMLTITANSSYTGDTRLYDGILRADKGTGIPADSHLQFRGGSWAPVNGNPMVYGIGTGANEWDVQSGTSAGFSAVGNPLTVNIGGAAAAVNVGDHGFGQGDIVLNEEGADAPLTFQNPLMIGNCELRIGVNSTISSATAELQGVLAEKEGETASSFVKKGAGTLALSGGVVLSNTLLSVRGGTAEFRPASFRMRDGEITENATLRMLDGADIVFTNKLALGNDATHGMLEIRGGSLRLGMLVVGYRNTAEVNQYGGTVSIVRPQILLNYENAIGEYNNSYSLGKGYYNLFDGNLSVHGNFQVGRYGYGEMNQYAGRVDVANWMSIGRFASSTGEYSLVGGTLSLTNTAEGLIIGEEGVGTMTVSGTGVLESPNRGITISGGTGTTKKSSLVVRAGGTVKTTRIHGGTRADTDANLTVDGGTLVVTGENRVEDDFLKKLRHVQVGDNGMTVDTGNNTVALPNFHLDTWTKGALVKQGSGCLVVSNLNAWGGGVTVNEGRLSLNGSRLVHRWSFNGTLTDSVTGQDAIYQGTEPLAYNNAKNAVSLKGGRKGTSWIDLGSFILPVSDNGVTIELWATQREIQNWSRILDIGVSQSDDLLFGWSNGTNPQKDAIACKEHNGAATYDGLAPYTLNQEFHICMVITNNEEEGRSTMVCYKQDVTTGETLKKVPIPMSNWRLGMLDQQNCWLGHSQFPDNDASADYNEVRIWDGTLSESQLSNNARLGPDSVSLSIDREIVAPVVQNPGTEGNILPDHPGEALLDNNYLCHRWSFNGSLRDSVAGQDAIRQGTSLPTYDKQLTSVILQGGVKGTSWIDLGANILPRDNSPVTIELWGTQRSLQKWSRIIDIGGSITNNMLMAWSNMTSIDKDGVCVYKVHVQNALSGLAPYTLNKEFHISMVITTNLTGETSVVCRKKDVLTGETLATVSFTTDVWSLSQQAMDNCWLGHSQFPDNDASASYNEVRIWNAALSEKQLENNVLLGADVLPVLNPELLETTPEIRIATGASFDLRDNKLSVKRMTGEGTIENGQLTVTDVLAPGGVGNAGTLDIASSTIVTGTVALDPEDVLTVSGALDLRAASLDFARTGRMSGAYVLITSTSGGITGPFRSTNLPGGYSVRYRPTVVKAVPVGTYLFLR